MVLLFLSATSACIPGVMNCRPWIYWLFSGEIRGFFFFEDNRCRYGRVLSEAVWRVMKQ